ncbi:MAG: cation diffusion facilitator family transporter [Halolamina sp.]
MAENKSVVFAALVANAAIAALKFGGFLLTGSPSMLSETYHSVSDTGNQVFLLVGIRYSEKPATQAHPFGYGRAQFFYSFLVSVLLFGIAGWESLKHGYESLTHGGGHGGAASVAVPGVGEVDPVWVNVVVLLGAVAFESYAFREASAELRRQIAEYDWSGFREAFRRTSDVTTLTAFTEDAVALGGAVLALVGVGLTELTGNETFDAATAVLIGALLMGFALALAWQNKRLLLGESLAPAVEDDLRRVAADHDGVAHVDGLRTVFIGPQKVLVTADVSFDPDYSTGAIDDAIGALEAELEAADDRVATVYVEPEV